MAEISIHCETPDPPNITEYQGILDTLESWGCDRAKVRIYEDGESPDLHDFIRRGER